MPSSILNRRLVSNPYPMLAGQFVAASNQFGTIADQTALSFSGAAFTVAAWAYQDSKGANRGIVAKGQIGAVAAEYYLAFGSAADRYTFAMSNGAALSTVNANTFGSPPLATWNYIVGWYVAATSVNISVNNGTTTTSATANNVQDVANAFRVGSDSGAGSNRWDGRIDTPAVWNRVLTTDERTFLYNGGVGMAYRDLPASLLSGLVFFSDMDGDLTDKSGNGFHLTNTAGVTFVQGKR